MATVQDLAATLDDYTGSLSKEVEKLELEYRRGALGSEEQLDLVDDLRQALRLRWIRPWRRKAVVGGVVGLACLGAAYALPQLLAGGDLMAWLLAGAGFVALAWTGYSAGKTQQYRRLECAFLKDVEAAIRMGGTVFDVKY